MMAASSSASFSLLGGADMTKYLALQVQNHKDPLFIWREMRARCS
ncbi:hypothetical protein ANRL1_03886 [Anaerolineae bacterium]|nr:hypothetical protein ANRL1_03886 [Anaerolineae bacterium]